MSKANKQAICDVLLERGAVDRDIVVLCSDSRGSGSMSDFASALPSQFVETGIAEQNLVSISAGLAHSGKKAFAVSPACFLSTRSMEQVKVDVAYSNTNVTLIGISGGVSYGALGMTHHSANDIATLGSIPNMRVYIPSDSTQTAWLISQLLNDASPAYVRVGRNAVKDIYKNDGGFQFNKASKLCDGDDILIIACGEMVSAAADAARLLSNDGITACVLDMYCIKPIDKAAVLENAKNKKAVITIEEHTAYGGLGAQVSQIIAANDPKRVINLCLPDAPVVTGTSQQIFDYYSLNADGIVNATKGALAK